MARPAAAAERLDPRGAARHARRHESPATARGSDTVRTLRAICFATPVANDEALARRAAGSAGTGMGLVTLRDRAPRPALSRSGCAAGLGAQRARSTPTRSAPRPPTGRPRRRGRRDSPSPDWTTVAWLVGRRAAGGTQRLVAMLPRRGRVRLGDLERGLAADLDVRASGAGRGSSVAPPSSETSTGIERSVGPSRPHLDGHGLPCRRLTVGRMAAEPRPPAPRERRGASGMRRASGRHGGPRRRERRRPGARGAGRGRAPGSESSGDLLELHVLALHLEVLVEVERLLEAQVDRVLGRCDPSAQSLHRTARRPSVALGPPPAGTARHRGRHPLPGCRDRRLVVVFDRSVGSSLGSPAPRRGRGRWSADRRCRPASRSATAARAVAGGRGQGPPAATPARGRAGVAAVPRRPPPYLAASERKTSAVTPFSVSSTPMPLHRDRLVEGHVRAG